MNSSPMTSTYSMWSLFRNCRKACEYRYEIGLVPREKDSNLSFGSLIHECLQTWHETRDLTAVIDFIDRACASRRDDDNVRRDWHLAHAIMTGYATRYPHEEFEIVALEKTFEGAIINPVTGASSRSFVLAGKVDGIVRIGGDHYILEHKTAATIDAAGGGSRGRRALPAEVPAGRKSPDSVCRPRRASITAEWWAGLRRSPIAPGDPASRRVCGRQFQERNPPRGVPMPTLRASPSRAVCVRLLAWPLHSMMPGLYLAGHGRR